MSISNDAARCGVHLNGASRELMRAQDPSVRRHNEAYVDYIMTVSRNDRAPMTPYERAADVEVTLSVNQFSEHNAALGLPPQDGRITPRATRWDDVRYSGRNRVDPTRAREAYTLRLSEDQFRELLTVVGPSRIGNDFGTGGGTSGYKQHHYSLRALTMDNEAAPAFYSARTRGGVRSLIAQGELITLDDVLGTQAVNSMYAAVDDAVVSTQHSGELHNVAETIEAASTHVCSLARDAGERSEWVDKVEGAYGDVVADIRQYNEMYPENPIVDYVSTAARGNPTSCVLDPARAPQTAQAVHDMTGVTQQGEFSVAAKMAQRDAEARREAPVAEEPAMLYAGF